MSITIENDKVYCTTSVGTAVGYVFLTKADEGKNLPNKKIDATFKLTLEFPAADLVACEILDKVKEMYAAEIAEAKRTAKPNRKVIEQACPVYLDEARDVIVMSAKLYRDRSFGSQAPKLVDAEDKEWDLSKEIWAGSELEMYFQVVPYTSPTGAGVSLRMLWVRVSKLVSKGSKNPFDKVKPF